MSSSKPNRFRFKPRFRAFALGSIALGIGLLGLSALIAFETGELYGVPLAAGGAGVMLGLLYLGSPTWRLTVVIDDEALEVRSRSRRRFRLPWGDIVEVVASPDTKTCFVDGGKPARSLLVPGPGASAGYDIENKHELYEVICARVADERIREVDLLENSARRPSGGDAGPAAEADAGDEPGRSAGGEP